MVYQPADRGPLDERFWLLFAVLGPYAERRNLRVTIGSEARPAGLNPLFDRRRAPAPLPPRIPQQRRGHE